MNRTLLQSLEEREVDRELAPIAGHIHAARLERTVVLASLVAGALVRIVDLAAALGRGSRRQLTWMLRT